jgi:hypothetical protein
VFVSFPILLVVLVATYLLLNFVVQPRLVRAWQAHAAVSRAAKAGLLGAVQFVRTATLVTSVVYLLFALLTVGLNFGFGRNASVLRGAIDLAASVHTGLESIQKVWSKWFFLLPLALLVFMHWRTVRDRLSGRAARLVDDELDRLNAERARTPTDWERPPDEGMTKLDTQMADARARLGELSRDSIDDRTERRRLLRLISQLAERRNDLDYQRRMDLTPLVPSADQDNVRPWRRILTSRGLFSDLRAVSKLLGTLAHAMVSIALVGVAGTAGLTAAVRDGMIRLDDLRVEARKSDAEKLWKDHLTPATSLSESDREAINHLASDFARALSSNLNWHAPHVLTTCREPYASA